MFYIIAAILAGTIGFTISQAWLIRQLRNHYSHPLPVWPIDKPWPKATVILSLRGNDPFLESCLRNLIRQDYPNFFVQIVIDSDTDPAWTAIQAVQSECGPTRLRVTTLQHRRFDCSLKNSSIIQAINGLPEETEVVAFVDADAITHSTWLRELVVPLADPEIGCTTGIRWFAPTDNNFATRLRCFWNLIAASGIFHSSTPWGGSMVVRRQLLDTGLAEEWSHMFCEDVHTLNHLQRRNLKLVCVPQATVVNRESTTVMGCLRFVNRQMLILRLYHPQWWSVVAMITFTAVLRSCHYFFICKTFMYGEWLSCLALLLIRPINLFVTQYEANRLDQAVRQMVVNNGQEITPNPVPDFVGYLCAEAMFLSSMLYALGARFVNWRGITYKVKGPSDIKMLAYQPFLESLASTGMAKRSSVV